MPREDLQNQIDELMRQYANDEVDSATYIVKMVELTTSAQSDDTVA